MTNVIVWNDPINLMSYVTLAFQQLIGYSRTKATRLMLQVHNRGKALVSSGSRRRRSTTSPGCTLTGSGRPCDRTSPCRYGRSRAPATARIRCGCRELVRALPGYLEQLLDTPDNPDRWRLFPAVSEDAETQAEYSRLVGGELLDGRRRALTTIRETVGRDSGSNS